MPQTFTALAVLLAAATPGYVFIRIVETRVPRRRRSPLMEIVDLVCVGATSSLISVLVVFVLARYWTALLPIEGLLQGTAYVRLHAWQAVWSATLALASSICLSAAAGLAESWRRRAATRNTPASAFHRIAELTPPDHHPFLAVHLMDGRVWEGFLKGMDDEPGSLAEGDLVLQGPLALTVPGHGRIRHPAGFAVVPGGQIAVIYGSYLRPERQPLLQPDSSAPEVTPNTTDEDTGPSPPQSRSEWNDPTPTDRALTLLGIMEPDGVAHLHRLRTPILVARSPEAVQEASRIADGVSAQGDADLLGRAHHLLAQHAWMKDNYPSTVEHAEIARRAYERAGDRVGAARAAQSRANVLRITSDPQALAALTEALALARAAQDAVTEATLWLDLALVAQQLGDTATYAARIEEAERCLRPSLLAAGHAARNLGEVQEQRRNMAAARESYRRAVRLYEVADAPAPATATALCWWGRAERVQGDAEHSRELLESAVTKATSGGGDLVAEAESRRELALADKLAGNLRAAVDGLRRARTAVNRIGGENPLTLANIEFEMGELVCMLSGPEQSRAHFEAAYRWYERADEPRGLHNAARELAHLAMDEEDAASARTLLNRATTPLGRQSADPMSRLRLLTSLGRLLSLEAHSATDPARTQRRAERVLSAALKGFERLSQLRNQAMVLLTALRGGVGVGGYGPVQAGEEAVRLYTAARDHIGAIEAQWALSQAWLEAEDGGRALHHGCSALLAIETVRATSPDAVTGLASCTGRAPRRCRFSRLPWTETPALPKGG
jgi:tetratricopeptide (TPR) repeat protein